MKLLDENLLAEVAGDTEAPGELAEAEEDKDFLKNLEKMAEEVQDEAGSID
jgi:hypothetical protein